MVQLDHKVHGETVVNQAVVELEVYLEKEVRQGWLVRQGLLVQVDHVVNQGNLVHKDLQDNLDHRVQEESLVKEVNEVNQVRQEEMGNLDHKDQEGNLVPQVQLDGLEKGDYPVVEVNQVHVERPVLLEHQVRRFLN